MDNSLVKRQAAIDALCSVCGNDCNKSEFVYDGKQEDQVILCPEHYALTQLPSVQPEWNNHTVACLLAELFDDTCACNYNGINEWLPEKCKVIDSCPNPVGVACWEQYLKHRVERRTDGQSNADGSDQKRTILEAPGKIVS